MRSALPSAVNRVEGRLRPRLFHLLDFRPMFSVEFFQLFECLLTVHLRFKALELLLIAVLHRLLDRADCIEQGAVVLLSFLRDHTGRLGGDEPLCNQSVDVFFHGVLAQSHRRADGLVARVTLKGFPVLAEHQISVHRDLACREIQTKYFVGQRKNRAPLCAEKQKRPTHPRTTKRGVQSASRLVRIVHVCIGICFFCMYVFIPRPRGCSILPQSFLFVQSE